MTSSEPTNETTANFIKALSEFDPGLDPVVVIKLTYDPETKYVTGCTFGDTLEPFVEITQEQWKNGFHCQPLEIVDSKPVPRVFNPKTELRLVPGDKWHTDKDNMLIMGKERGWSERSSS